MLSAPSKPPLIMEGGFMVVYVGLGWPSAENLPSPGNFSANALGCTKFVQLHT